MAKTKIALLYERLSCDDELSGESLSIQNHNFLPANLSDYFVSGQFFRASDTRIYRET